MWGWLDTTEMLSITAASATLLYTTIARIPRTSRLVLRVSCVALVATALLGAPLLGLAALVLALGFAAATRNRYSADEHT